MCQCRRFLQRCKIAANHPLRSAGKLGRHRTGSWAVASLNVSGAPGISPSSADSQNVTRLVALTMFIDELCRLHKVPLATS